MNTLTNEFTNELTNDMNKEKLTSLFETSFDHASTDTKIYVSNLYYREACGDGENEVFENTDDFFETYFTTPMEAVRATHFGHYNYSDEYVWFNAYGNLDSANFEEDLPLADPTDMAEWYMEHDWALDDLRAYEEFMEFMDALESGDDTEDEE